MGVIDNEFTNIPSKVTTREKIAKNGKYKTKTGIEIFITESGEYNAIEPPIPNEIKNIVSKLFDFVEARVYETIDSVFDIDLEQRTRIIHEKIKEVMQEPDFKNEFEIISNHKDVIAYHINRNIGGYKLIDVLMNDEKIEDIVCNGAGKPIYVRHKDFMHKYEFLTTNIRYPSEEQLKDHLRIFLADKEKEVNPSSITPIIYESLGKHRITIGWEKTVSSTGTFYYIRKFPENPYTVIDLLNQKVLNDLMASYIWIMKDAKAFIMIAGDVGTGKTTLLGSLAELSKSSWHIVTIEDSKELKIPHKVWSSYETQISTTINHRQEITAYDLLKLSLRAIPSETIIGEVRGGEAKLAFQYIPSGHGGWFTFHAESIDAALRKLTTDTFGVTKAQIQDLWCVIFTKNIIVNEKNVRRITQIAEIEKYEGKKNTVLNQIFNYDSSTDTSKPYSTDDLLKKNSQSLEKAAERLKISDMKAEIKKRINHIHKLKKFIKENPEKNNPEDIHEFINTFYFN